MGDMRRRVDVARKGKRSNMELEVYWRAVTEEEEFRSRLYEHHGVLVPFGQRIAAYFGSLCDLNFERALDWLYTSFLPPSYYYKTINLLIPLHVPIRVQ
jgi:hypothetical protein